MGRLYQNFAPPDVTPSLTPVFTTCRLSSLKYTPKSPVRRIVFPSPPLSFVSQIEYTENCNICRKSPNSLNSKYKKMSSSLVVGLFISIFFFLFPTRYFFKGFAGLLFFVVFLSITSSIPIHSIPCIITFFKGDGNETANFLK